jgi:hypothetical protein
MHLDDERLQRLIDGELTPVDEAAAREHVARCAECRRALAASEHDAQRAHLLLRALDEPVPELDAETVAALAREGVRPPRSPAQTGRHQPLWPRRITALALALGLAGAAFALPGSPVAHWVRSWGERIRPARTSARTPDAEPANPTAGIAVPPGTHLAIEFLSRQAEGEIRVSLSDDAELVIRAPIDGATFTSDVDRIVVDNHGRAASFHIHVPRAAPRVEIRVEGVPRLLKEGTRITLALPGADGTYRIPLTSP